jgi:hypothetical protein
METVPKRRKQNKFVNKQKPLQMQVFDMLVLLGVLYKAIKKKERTLL